MRSCLYQQRIATGLGTFELQLESTGELLDKQAREGAEVLCSTGHRVLIRQLAAPTAWLPGHLHVAAAKAWLLTVEKHNEAAETLTIHFSLLAADPGTRAGPDTGEYLTAVEFENGTHQVHIGTPDEEAFVGYGKASLVPPRLVPALADYALVITSVEADGLKTVVPALFAGESFYLHYILAESPRRKSTEYPDEWDVSTWYAVDQSADALEEAWRQQAGQAPA